MTLEMELKEYFKAGKAEGRAEGKAEGRAEGKAELIEILRALNSGKSVEEIVKEYNVEIEIVEELNSLRG